LTACASSAGAAFAAFEKMSAAAAHTSAAAQALPRRMPINDEGSPPGLSLRPVQNIDVLAPSRAQPGLSIPIVSSCRVEAI
jgi:hypothetical protein